MSVHKSAKYLHIGCDEVFHLGECPPCMSQGLTRSQIFVDHVKAVSAYVRETYGVEVIIWDDMLRYAHLRTEIYINSKVPLFVFLMVGPTQNARSLLTPVQHNF